MGLTLLFNKNLTDILPGTFICINIIKRSKTMINTNFSYFIWIRSILSKVKPFISFIIHGILNGIS